MALLSVHSARACLNSYSYDNVVVAIDSRAASIIKELTEHHRRENWQDRVDQLRKKSAGGDYRALNDLAVALIYTGAYQDAREILERIEAAHPGSYMTASNLGTAYELCGNNIEALRWIKTGIQLNPGAHRATEWLHVKILEAKIAMEVDPTWIVHREVFDRENAIGNVGNLLGHEEVALALKIQLHERLPFSKPPDALVGKLLYALGEEILKSRGQDKDDDENYSEALGVFQLASEYLSGIPGLEDLTQKSRKQIGYVRDHFVGGNRWFGWLVSAFVLAGVFAVLWLIWALKQKPRLY